MAYPEHIAGLIGPAAFGASVTPNDSVDLANPSRALWVGGAGNINLDTVGGDTIVLVGITAGSLIPIQAARVRSTSTTATSIVALY